MDTRYGALIITLILMLSIPANAAFEIAVHDNITVNCSGAPAVENINVDITDSIANVTFEIATPGHGYQVGSMVIHVDGQTDQTRTYDSIISRYSCLFDMSACDSGTYPGTITILNNGGNSPGGWTNGAFDVIFKKTAVTVSPSGGMSGYPGDKITLVQTINNTGDTDVNVTNVTDLEFFDSDTAEPVNDYFRVTSSNIPTTVVAHSTVPVTYEIVIQTGTSCGDVVVNNVYSFEVIKNAPSTC